MAVNRAGFWGPITATLDWCEANYQFSHYIAESANTYSNLISIVLALLGFLAVRRENLPFRYAICHIGFGLVGIGSFAFHATLTYEAQLCDELPMIYVAAYNAFLLLDTKHGFTMDVKSRVMLFITIAFQIFFTWTYYLYRNPVYHEIIFALLIIAPAAIPPYVLRTYPIARSISPKVRSEVYNLFLMGLGNFAFGFLIWNLDNIFCDYLTKVKVTVGWPAAFLLEGHSWWHAFTALGTFYLLQAITYLCVLVKDDPRKYVIKHSFGLPYVCRVVGDKSS